MLFYFMAYSLDLRRRVINFVKNGGSKVESASRFKVSRATVHRWLIRTDLSPTKVTNRNRKLDINALIDRVKSYPEARLHDHAQFLGVTHVSIWKAFKKLGITRKKNCALQGKKPYFTYEVPKNIARIY